MQPSLYFPLQKQVRITSDTLSFRTIDLAQTTEIPLGAHPGAFGAYRKYHRHEGVDLYGLEGDTVFALHSGTVVAKLPFTGAAAGSTWWLDTECVLVECELGVFNYGEISPVAGLGVGDSIQAGEPVGTIIPVLRVDKGRPRTMLHFERYHKGTRKPVETWALDEPQPSCLLDPTELLVKATKHIQGIE